MSKFQPGQKKPINSGRKRGTPNKKSQILTEALRYHGIDIPQQLSETLPQLTPDKRADVLLSLMQFIYPKKKAVEYSFQEQDSPNEIKIQVVSSPKNSQSLSG